MRRLSHVSETSSKRESQADSDYRVYKLVNPRV
nr:MAG TPA: light-harvesting protein [Caudoviricetes sp.]